MNSRLVRSCIKILRLLLDGNTSVNRIIEQTSRDRSHIIDVLNELERAQLLKTISSHERKDKKIKELTPLGQELAKLIKGIDQYEISYLELIKTMTQNFGISEASSQDVVKSKLHSKNWEDNEIISYNQWVQEARLFGLKSANAFIIAIFFRYAFLLFKTGANELACNILATIFSNAINRHFSNGLIAFINAIKSTYDVSKNEQEIIKSMLGQLKAPVLKYISDSTRLWLPPAFRPLQNRFVKKEADRIIDSIYYMIEPLDQRDLLNSLTSIIRHEPTD